MPHPPFTVPTHLAAAALDDGSYRVRLAGAFGPLQPASILSFGQLVDTLLAWRSPVQTACPVVCRLAEMTRCSLVATAGAVPGEPMVFAA